MKRKFLVLCVIYIFTLMIAGCSEKSNDSSTEATQPQTSEQVQTTDQKETELKTEPESTASTTKSYNDGTISCEYNSSSLALAQLERSDDVPYFTLIRKTSDKPSDSIKNGNYLCISTLSFEDSSMLYKNYPTAFTQALFNGLFHVDESVVPEIAKKGSIYEYELNNKEFAYKGKILDVTDNMVTFAYIQATQDLSTDIISDFTDCYNSLNFIKKSDEKETTTSKIPNLDDIEDNAESEAAKAKKITNGELYDSITAIYPDVILYDMDNNDLLISIYMSAGSVESNSVGLFYFTNEILNNCNIEKEYSSVSVNMMAEDKLTAMLTLLSYESSTSYKSDFIVLDSKYEKDMKKIYEEGFLTHDIESVFDSELESIADKYGIK